MVWTQFIYIFLKKKTLTFKFFPLQSPKNKNSPVTMSNPSDQFGILKDFFSLSFFCTKRKQRSLENDQG